MLAMVAQWMGLDNTHANSVAPILISRKQGKQKSTYIKMLVPPELQNYYTDDFNLNSKGQATRKLSEYGLICMDEFDKETTKKMPLLKNLMQMASLSFIKSYQKSFSKLPRIASFAGTSNRKDILTDPSGSRRFICIEVEEKINTEDIIHSQIYAQLKQNCCVGSVIGLTVTKKRKSISITGNFTDNQQKRAYLIVVSGRHNLMKRIWNCRQQKSSYVSRSAIPMH